MTRRGILIGASFVGPTFVDPALVAPTFVDPTVVGPALVAPTFVGIDPGGLSELADGVDECSRQLSAAVAVCTDLLARLRPIRDVLCAELGAVRRALDGSSGELRWRAGVIAQSVDPIAAGPCCPDRWLACCASLGALRLSSQRQDLTTQMAARWLSELRSREPDEVADAFAVIPRERARRLAFDHPRLVGGLDGAPTSLRFVANRILIANEINRLEEAASKLEAQSAVQSPPGLMVRRIRERSAEYRRWLVEGRQILLFDPQGDGLVAEVFGDIDAASAVGVLVPGMANDLGNFGTPACGFRADALDLFAAAGSATATVAWLGYDTPDGVDAAGRSAAVAAAPELARFVRSVDPQDERTVTVFAHSYGSVVAGMASRDGLDADNLVLLGSPGTTLNNAGEAVLRDGARVWSALAPGDPIGLGIDPGASYRWWHLIHPLLPIAALSSSLLRRKDLWHGANPVDDGFGAIRIDTEGSFGHSRYYEATTLDNLALILTGRYDEVAPAN
ncbi:MAG: alpha/beta hydrolase [Acidimicrobiia bacterium]|nr:alpha/beta hydrolase [Acidimicrobiia bacterium]